MKKIGFAFGMALLALTALTEPSGGPVATMNLVNFVRSSLDPRTRRDDIVDALRGEVQINRKHEFRNTILFQYDALLDDELVGIARQSDSGKTEFGVWIELCRPLVEKIGLEWHSSRGWDWDWHVNPGFLMAYAPGERCAIIDEIFAKFKEMFGAYPKSVGSWLLDAHSLGYMVDRYGVDGFCICREQDSTDAYGLRGGYSNGAYYPSRRNMLSAATDIKNAIPAPVFRMLTPDPIYNYSNPEKLYSDFPKKIGCATLEPVWYSGQTPGIVDWYFRVYCESPALLNLSYMQTGQENAFGWKKISKGLPYQIEKVEEYVRAGKLRLETLGESARRFKREHLANCAQTQIALEDWTGCGRNSIWYNCANYRANLMLEKGNLFFRDIHVMRDDYAEPYLDKPCKCWQALYFTPPVVDPILSVSNAAFSAISFPGKYRSIHPTGDGHSRLTVECAREDGGLLRVEFSKEQIGVTGGAVTWDRLRTGRIPFAFNGYCYSVECTIAQDGKGMTLDLREKGDGSSRKGK